MFNHDITHNESTSFAEVSEKSPAGRSYQVVDVSIYLINMLLFNQLTFYITVNLY